ncbi:hypothetical protein G6O69_01070 [Pseudenhygromyxa sp. WMMC2535]|uniref:hypothetical protein n=1 Tax=Pseudenhygromyxa sp. WMMC2535 TaxID=2712867 RepID=UPI0015961DD4|nr:hypothetical protein [Pseudenhygromyxa sp. WMMC2535]NVB36402.1 hypothetical protein [Pseudenhygromyxa sp. WMMC2535]
MEPPEAGFDATWRSMDAAERREYLGDEDPPATWTTLVAGVRVTWSRDGGVTCGRYPGLSATAWASALDKAGGPETRDNLIAALHEVAGEVAVMHPERHCLMVAGWVADGERPRNATARKPKPEVGQKYDALEQQRSRPSGRRAL